jgi:hypothetical protein
VQLGAGDLGLPLMLAISSYKLSFNYFIPISVYMGSTAGMLFTMYIQKKYLIPLPAIPPLFSFMSIALGLATLTISLHSIYLVFVGLVVLLIFVYGAKRSAKKAS